MLRPIIERLEARGHEVEVTAREYGQTVGILDRLGIPYTSRRRVTAAASTVGKARALARPQRARSRAGRGGSGFDLALGARLGRHRGGLDAAADPVGADAGLRARRPPAPDRFRAARRVLVPDAIPVEAMAQAGRAPSASSSATRG